MYRSSLLKAVKTLDKKESKSFLQYLKSPLFNRHEKLLGLYELIIAQSPGFDKHLEKEKLFAELYPEKAFSEESLRNLASDLLEHLEKYLCWLEVQEEEELGDRLLLRQLKKRELHSRFFSRFKKIFKRRKRKGLRDVQWFDDDHRLLTELNEVHSHRNDADYDRSLQLRSNQLDHHYLALKLSLSCEMINRKNVFNKQLQARLLNPLLREIESELEYYKKIPAIYLYYLVLMTLMEPEEPKHYNLLVTQLHTQIHFFSKAEGRALYKYAQNYCIKNINQGDNAYLASLLGLYKRLLGSQLILENGRISDSDYRNIVTVGLRLREFDWVEEFIHKYENYLGKEQRANAYSYNLAAYFYERADYAKAQELLNKLAFSNVFYSLGVRSLLLKIYFDTRESEALFSLIKSFKTYLRRNKQLSKYQVTIYSNLLKFSQQAARLQQNRELIEDSELKKAVKGLLKDIEKTREIANINWLQGAVKGLLPE